MGLTRREALEVLGLEEGATDKEIKDRFKRLALKWHPDKNPDDPKAAEEKFQKLSAAYTHLKHEDETEEYFEYDAISLAELLLEMFGRGFMYDPFIPTTPYCSCPHCQAERNSEWMEDRLHMMREEREGEFFEMDDADDDEEEERMMMEERQRRREMYRRDILEDERQKEYIRDYHEATAKVIGDRLVKQFADKLYNTYNQPSRTSKKGSSTPQFKVGVSSEEASRNAKQLLEAEEKAKREREKKRERNKKKKEAKKKRKATQQKKESAKAPQERAEVEEAEESEHDDQEEDTSDSDEFDVTSAFIARASKKQSAASQKPRPSPKDSSPLSNPGTVSSTSLHSAEDSPTHSQSALHTLDPEAAENDLAQSRKLASLGNRAAKDGHFGEAVRRYTEAIELYPYDHRYFGNRSFCYDLLQNYTSALEDANRAIALDVSWAKGYYRQGRAFAGLKRYDLAEGSYISALKYDPKYQDAMDELVKIRVEQLKGMGFPTELCEAAVKEFGTVQASIDAILAGKVVASVPEVDVYPEPSPPPPDPPQSKPTTRERFKLPPRMQARASQPEPQQPKKEKPSANSEKRSLWVGNITSDDITEEMLFDLFKQYGPIASVKLLTPRHCAFVNYRKPGSAAQALKHLQGYHLGGSYLLVRYPETSNKNPYMLNMKKPGPVNGTECYYWRTTGCSFGIKCRYEHIPENKGIDLPAMM